MPDDFTSFWPAFVAALGIGVATAVFVGPDAQRRSPPRWLVWTSAAALAGAVAVALGAIQGEVAHFVVVGIACFVAFLVGASAVGGARGAFGAHERLALGLIPLALLWGVAVFWPQSERISASFSPLGPASLPDEGGGDEIKPALPPPAASSVPAASLAALPAGELDATTCQRALDAVATAEPVFFNPTHATIHRRASDALDRAAEVIRRCPQASIEVIGFDDGPDTNPSLALRRARAAERYLRAEGVGGRKLASRAADAHAARPGRGVIGYALRREGN